MSRVKEERQAHEWSQHDLGRRTGLPASTISAIENGHVRIWPGWRRRLALAFKLPEEVLFPEVVEEPRVS
jgi:transcriptional regulator with XRE-family HTH domain